MRHSKKIPICVFMLFVAGLATLQAQTAAPASGGEASGSGGSASYTIGQVVYTANAGSGGTEAQGVQHPFEIYTTTIIDSSLVCELFPNPTTQVLNLTIKHRNSGNYSYQLYDVAGKYLESNSINQNQTIINMESYASAPYMLVVQENNKKIKVFKVIKY